MVHIQERAEVHRKRHYPRYRVRHVQRQQRIARLKHREYPHDSYAAHAHQRYYHGHYRISHAAHLAYHYVHRAAGEVRQAEQLQPLYAEVDYVHVAGVYAQQLIPEQIHYRAHAYAYARHYRKTVAQHLFKAGILTRAHILTRKRQRRLIHRVHRRIHKAFEVGRRRVTRDRD